MSLFICLLICRLHVLYFCWAICQCVCPSNIRYVDCLCICMYVGMSVSLPAMYLSSVVLCIIFLWVCMLIFCLFFYPCLYFSVNMSINHCLSLCQKSVNLSDYPSAYLSVSFLSVSLFLYLSIHLFDCLTNWQNVCLSSVSLHIDICLTILSFSVSLSICLFCLFIKLSVLSVCPYISVHISVSLYLCLLFYSLVFLFFHLFACHLFGICLPRYTFLCQLSCIFVVTCTSV